MGRVNILIPPLFPNHGSRMSDMKQTKESMTRERRVVGWLVGALLIGATAWWYMSSAATAQEGAPPQALIAARAAEVLRLDGLLFKDLNKNGRLDPYEDWRREVEARVADLVGQMTIEEKAGLMVGPSLTVGPNYGVSEQPTYMVSPFNPGPPAMVSPSVIDDLS